MRPPGQLGSVPRITRRSCPSEMIVGDVGECLTRYLPITLDRALDGLEHRTH